MPDITSWLQQVRRWERDHVVGVVGSGTGKLVVDTGSGNVTVRKG